MAHRGNRSLCLFPMVGMEATCDGLHDPVDYLLKSVGANRSLIARPNVRDLLTRPPSARRDAPCPSEHRLPTSSSLGMARMSLQLRPWREHLH